MASSTNYALYTVCLLFLNMTSTFGQDTIKILNPSLEGIPKYGGTKSVYSRNYDPVNDWFDVGWILFPKETGYDVHDSNQWNIEAQPSDGNTFLGLVCRENQTYEGLGQVLSTELDSGKCYVFSAALAQCEYPGARIDSTSSREDYYHLHPAHLKIIGVLKAEEPEDLLVTSPAVTHREWKTYTFKLRPKQTAASIRLVINSESTPPKNGNLLIDNLSDIIEVSCEE